VRDYVSEKGGVPLRASHTAVDRVRAQTDIVELVGQYLELRRSGDNHRGLCPFHKEKTPSFNVNQSRQIFHCFGCGVGGDAFKFLMLHDGLTFPEALRALAHRAGIELEPETPKTVKRRAERTKLTELNDFAANFFKAKLKSPQGAKAVKYIERRGLSTETAEQFMLGYAPEPWTHCTDAAAKQGFTAEAIERSGLGKRRKSGDGLYELFRDRLMFPIRNISGAVVAFGGRALGDDEPKYINSPETELYQKGDNLYGLYEARDAIRQDRLVIIVEGYMDLLQVVQAGFPNVVATLGTALTDGQAALVRRFAESAALIYDGDTAGVKAAERGIAILARAGIEPRVVLLPQGSDPDDFIREHGPAGFRDAIDEAADMVDFVLRDGVGKKLTPSEKSALASRAFTIIAAIGDTIRQSDYLRVLADKLKVGETSIRREFAKHQRQTPRDHKGDVRGPKWADVTIDLVQALIKNPEYVEKARKEIDVTMMREGPERELFEALFDHGADGVPAEKLLGRLESEDAQRLMSRILVESDGESEDVDKALFDGWLHKMRIYIVRKRMIDINSDITEAQQQNDDSRLSKLLRQHVESGKLLSSLQTGGRNRKVQ
jgi:DNA primase